MHQLEFFFDTGLIHLEFMVHLACGVNAALMQQADVLKVAVE
jgi:hypothetical protein